MRIVIDTDERTEAVASVRATQADRPNDSALEPADWPSTRVHARHLREAIQEERWHERRAAYEENLHRMLHRALWGNRP